MYTYVHIHTAKLSSRHIWNNYYMCVCIHMHTQSMCVFLNIFTYTIVIILRVLAGQHSCWGTGQIGLSPPAGLPKAELCVWQAASTVHHCSWTRGITPTRPPGIGINPFCRIVSGVWSWLVFFLFFNPKYPFPQPNRRKQLSSRKRWRKGQWGSWTRAWTYMKLQLQPAKGLGEGVAVLKIWQDRVQRWPKRASWVRILDSSFLAIFTELFPRKLLGFKNSFSIECRFLQVPWYFQTWVNSTHHKWTEVVPAYWWYFICSLTF